MNNNRCTISFQDAVASGEPVLLYNSSYHEYLSIANTMETMPGFFWRDGHNQFVLHPTGDGKSAFLFNESYKAWLSLSDTKNEVVANKFIGEKKSKFQLQSLDDGRFRIWNPTRDIQLMISDGVKGQDLMSAVPVSSLSADQKKSNEFDLELPQNPELVKIIYDLTNMKTLDDKLAPILLGKFMHRNQTSVTQTANFAINRTELIPSTFTWKSGVKIGGAVTTKTGVNLPFVGAGFSATLSADLSFESGKSNSAATSATFTGVVQVNSAGKMVTTETFQVTQVKAELPYTMILRSKNTGNLFTSCGIYTGNVPNLYVERQTSEKPL